jgi:hypothetical protein
MARDRSWNYTVDGIDSNETSAGGSDLSPVRVNPDSLAEFRTMTSNRSAEYGRNSSGQVAMITQSGTNQIHGDGFWFYRTPRFNANDYGFDINGLGKAQFVQNIYGGSIGGSIIKNRWFVFTNIQALRHITACKKLIRYLPRPAGFAALCRRRTQPSVRRGGSFGGRARQSAAGFEYRDL